MVYQQTLNYSTLGRGTSNITRQVEDVISASGISTGTLSPRKYEPVMATI